MKPLVSFALGTIFATTALAAPQTYIIDSAQTYQEFEYRYLGGSIEHGRFDKTDGFIIFDSDTGKGRAEIRIDARSINTGNPALNRIIQGTDLFNTKKYPYVFFVSNDMSVSDGKIATVNGRITIKGISKPVILKVASFHCTPNPLNPYGICRAIASTIVTRSDFNMGKYAPLVSDEIFLNIVAQGTAENPANRKWNPNYKELSEDATSSIPLIDKD